MSESFRIISPEQSKIYMEELSTLTTSRWDALNGVKRANEAVANANRHLARHAMEAFRAMFTLPQQPDMLLVPLHHSAWKRACFQALQRHNHRSVWAEAIGMRHSLELAAKELCDWFGTKDWHPSYLAQRVCEANDLQGYLLLHSKDVTWENDASAATFWTGSTSNSLPLMVQGHRTFVRCFKRHDMSGMTWGVLRPKANDYRREDRAWFFDGFDKAATFAVALEADPDNPRKRPFAMPAGLTPASLFATV